MERYYDIRSSLDAHKSYWLQLLILSELFPIPSLLENRFTDGITFWPAEHIANQSETRAKFEQSR